MMVEYLSSDVYEVGMDSFKLFHLSEQEQCEKVHHVYTR